ncbi:lysis protein [Mangrovibacter plantisponsor]|uniref:Prophage endopeptidase n=1 Tax=Mangrovibacter plantisponsor TaxID=451513 RepID=A0A317PH47_9ENTR|nr:lysis protein [Mangrovibacter plantisponsor]PWV99580.1 prophage endopeptidase [Mangrovibacter plantisponsor]
MNRVTSVVCIALLGLVAILGWFVDHYRDNAITYKSQRDQATQSLNLANSTISDMQVRQRDVAALDAKYTGELADAKDTIEQLERDVVAGKRRLQLNAKCPANGETGSDGMGNASGARLTDAAQRDYFILRTRIETIIGQVNYLQNYIRQQCLN